MGDLRVPDLNKVFIAGRLTRDPELRYMPSGTALCKLSIANTRYYKSREGERREETCFVDASLWDKQAEWIGDKLRKGRPVLVEGSLRTDQWEDRATGQKRSKIEIRALRVTPLDWDDEGGGRPPRQQPQERPAAPPEPRPAPPPEPRVIEEPIPEDDIPF